MDQPIVMYRKSGFKTCQQKWGSQKVKCSWSAKNLHNHPNGMAGYEIKQKMLENLSGGCSANLKISSVQQAAEIIAPNGENIASYNSLGEGWTDIQTKEEHQFFSETASIYLQAFREARAEMKSSQPALSVETSVDIRA